MYRLHHQYRLCHWSTRRPLRQHHQLHLYLQQLSTMHRLHPLHHLCHWSTRRQHHQHHQLH